MINKTRLIKLTQDLIRIDSRNPGSDESAIAGYVKRYLNKLGLPVKTYEFRKKRTNVISILKPNKSVKRSLLITPHLDTVPPGNNWHFPPLAARIKAGKIYGLGATDCKVNLAAAMETITSLVEERAVLSYNLIFAATADEESGSGLGLIPLLDKGIIRPDAALVLDADDFDIIICQKGLIHLKVRIKGKRAHGAYPWLGRNAISKAVDILSDIKTGELFPAAGKTKYLRPPTVNIGTIRGGDKVNVVADWCEFELDLRYLPGASANEILKRLKCSIKKHTNNYKIEIEGIQKPYTIDEDNSLVRHLIAAGKKFGVNPVVKGSQGATVITFFQNKNIPAVATGFGVGKCAHSVDEYVTIENMHKGALMLEEFLKNYAPL